MSQRRVLAVVNQKGGVGKTTTTYHLARAAVRRGRSVLAVDLDPQANLTLIAAADDVPPDALSIADVLSPRVGEELDHVIIPGIWDGLSIAPATDAALAGVRDELVGVRVGREARLRQALAGADHDLVLLDCPPELGLLTINALVAADAVLIVTGSRLLAVQGVAGVLETISTVRTHYNPDLRLAGVVVNAHEARTLTGQARLEELRASVDVLDPPIPKRAAINDAAEAARGLDEWPDDGPHLATLYSGLLDTILERIS